MLQLVEELELNITSMSIQYKIIEKKESFSFIKLIEKLKEHNIIENQDLKNINKLRKLRNDAVHLLDFTLSTEKAAKFLEISRNITDIIMGNIWIKKGVALTKSILINIFCNSIYPSYKFIYLFFCRFSIFLMTA